MLKIKSKFVLEKKVYSQANNSKMTVTRKKTNKKITVL